MDSLLVSMVFAFFLLNDENSIITRLKSGPQIISYLIWFSSVLDLVSCLLMRRKLVCIYVCMAMSTYIKHSILHWAPLFKNSIEISQFIAIRLQWEFEDCVSPPLPHARSLVLHISTSISPFEWCFESVTSLTESPQALLKGWTTFIAVAYVLFSNM